MQVFTLISGTSRVEVPLYDALASELLASLDPHEVPLEVQLPAFMESRLHTIPRVLNYISTTTELDARAVIPSMQEAFIILPILEFLDTRPGVHMVFAYIKQTLARCATVDDVIACVYTEFDTLPLAEQRQVYEAVLARFSTLGGPGEPVA